MPGSVGATIAPITSVSTISGNQPAMKRLPEIITGSFPNGGKCQQGAPLVLSSGYLNESAAISTAVQIAGFSSEPSHKLAASGVSNGGISTGQSVQNQASASVIVVGSPPNDGTLGFEEACEDTRFVGYTDLAHTLALTDVGSTFGLTRDSVSGFWFVDTTITSTASGAILTCVELYDAVGTLSGRVVFKVNKANQLLST
jgi:hypothetical protein